MYVRKNMKTVQAPYATGRPLICVLADTLSTVNMFFLF
jgi:hypothetical protein